MKGAGARILMVAGAIVVFAVAGGLYLLGSPAQQRAKRVDAARVNDLRVITRAVDLYWRRHKVLPDTLQVLVAEPGLRFSIHDPASGQLYGYRVTGKQAYQLCAVFSRDSGEEGQRLSYLADRGIWTHGAGKRCFDLKVKTP